MGNKRIWEIDLLRVIAIMLMASFHTVYDLNEFLGIDIAYQSGFWFWEGKVSALTFIFLAGISSGLSKNTVRRGINVLGFGLGISIATFLFLREEYVRFGILHFLGTSMLLFPILKKLNKWVLSLATVIIALASIYVKNITLKTSLLLPLGFKYSGFRTIDFYPLFPYLAVFILGVIAYKVYYYKKQSLFKFEFQNESINYMSKNSLAIYLIHQPIIIAALFLFKFLAK